MIKWHPSKMQPERLTVVIEGAGKTTSYTLTEAEERLFLMALQKRFDDKQFIQFVEDNNDIYDNPFGFENKDL